MRHYSFIIIFLFSAFFSKAQDSGGWTLEQCIKHALEHNIDLKIQQNQEQKATYSRQQNEWSLLPSVNGWGSSSFDFRRSTNQNNEIASGSSYNMNYGISSSLRLFAGFTQLNTIAALRFNELAGHEGANHAANMLTITVTELFTQALYQKVLIDVVAEQVNISKHEAGRIAANIEAGLLEVVAQYEIDAMVSGQQLQLSQAQNEYQLMKLRLAQLIEITEDTEFEIFSSELATLVPDKNMQTTNNVYLLACHHYPAILQKEFEMEYYKKMLNVSKGYAAPSITLSGGYRSAFYSTDTLVKGNQTPMGTQLNNYLNPSLGLTLSIPLFNGRQTEFQIKRSKIDMENALYMLENQKKTIRREIEEAIFRLEAFRLEYQFAANNLVFVEKSFETFRERYRLGLVNSTEFMNAQNQLAKAKTELLRARYSWVVQEQTLQLYTGESYNDSIKKQGTGNNK